MDFDARKGLTLGSWIILALYILILGLGLLDFVRTTQSFASIFDQLGGELPWITRTSIMLADMITHGFLLVPIVLFVAFLIYKEIKWRSKIKTLIANNVAFSLTVALGYSLRLAMTLPMFEIIKALSE
jgi:type II secretory pathway component PulF